MIIRQANDVEIKKFRELFDDPKFLFLDYATFIAYQDREMLGAINWEDREEAIRIPELLVLPDYRYQGVGTALLLYIFNLAKKMNKEYVYLHSEYSAIPFYEKHGMVKDVEGRRMKWRVPNE